MQGTVMRLYETQGEKQLNIDQRELENAAGHVEKQLLLYMHARRLFNLYLD